MDKEKTWFFRETFPERQIIERLVGKYAVLKKYVDIGASDGITMSNTLFLAQDRWDGVCFEPDVCKVEVMAHIYRDMGNRVNLCHAAVTPYNVIPFLKAFGVQKDFGFLSLDIDSYDYFVLEELLREYRPAVMCVEINPVIPPPVRFVTLYPHTVKTGMSICTLANLAEFHGYDIVNLELINVFLVDRKINRESAMSPYEAWRSGYLERPDRLERIPWTKPYDQLLLLSPGKAVEMINSLFEKHHGKYTVKV